MIIFVSLSLLFQNKIMAQCDLPLNEQGKYELVEIVEMDSEVSDNDIYGSALVSMTELFNSAKDVIDIGNEKQSFIAGNFVVKPKPFSMGLWQSYFRFTIRLDFKDNKYRIKITYSGHEAFSSSNSCSCPNGLNELKCGASCLTKGQWKKQKCYSHNQVMSLVKQLKKQINENLKGNDDW